MFQHTTTTTINEWFSKFERLTVSYPSDLRTNEFLSLLDDVALKKWETMEEADKYDYDKIKTYLMVALRPDLDDYKIRELFYSLKHESHESVDDFYYKLYSFKYNWPKDDLSNFDSHLLRAFNAKITPKFTRT